MSKHRGLTPYGSRTYFLSRPPDTSAPPRGLILMLHGCRQNAREFAAGTRMNAHAGAAGMAVLWLEQDLSESPFGCWNWFRPRNQARDGGEPGILAEIVRTVRDELGIDPGAVFVGGFSAGAAMALVMRDVYSELFAAVLVHSGVATGMARSGYAAMDVMNGALPAMLPPSAIEPLPTLVIHGADDDVVHPDNAARIQLARGSGRGSRLELVVGGGHAWFGGDETATYTSAAGPNSTAMALEFFEAHLAAVTAPRARLASAGS